MQTYVYVSKNNSAWEELRMQVIFHRNQGVTRLLGQSIKLIAKVSDNIQPLILFPLVMYKCQNKLFISQKWPKDCLPLKDCLLPRIGWLLQ